MARFKKNAKKSAAIVIEPCREYLPEKEYLLELRKIADNNNCVLIFDEITSGWRLNSGGVHKIIKVNPDIVVYGKGIGNGYAISAILGKKKIMDISQDTFISSTFWTERIGFVAALKTIDIIVKNKVWEHLIEIGTYIGEGWLTLSKKHNLKIDVTDFKPLITMKFNVARN